MLSIYHMVYQLLQGKVWRIGLMGYNATPANVALVIDAFADGLKKYSKK